MPGENIPPVLAPCPATMARPICFHSSRCVCTPAVTSRPCRWGTLSKNRQDFYFCRMAAHTQQPSTVQHLWDRKSSKGKINHPVNLRTKEMPGLRQRYGKGRTTSPPNGFKMILNNIFFCGPVDAEILHLLDTWLSAACRSCSVPVNVQPVHVGGQPHAIKSLSNTNATGLLSE